MTRCQHARQGEPACTAVATGTFVTKNGRVVHLCEPHRRDRVARGVLAPSERDLRVDPRAAVAPSAPRPREPAAVPVEPTPSALTGPAVEVTAAPEPAPVPLPPQALEAAPAPPVQELPMPPSSSLSTIASCPVILPGGASCSAPRATRGLCKRHYTMAWNRGWLKRGESGPAGAEIVARLGEVEAEKASKDQQASAAEVEPIGVGVSAPEVRVITASAVVGNPQASMQGLSFLVIPDGLEPGVELRSTPNIEPVTVAHGPDLVSAILRGAGMPLTIKEFITVEEGDFTKAAGMIGARLRTELTQLGRAQAQASAERALSQRILRHPSLREAIIDVAIEEVGAGRLLARDVIAARHGGAVEVARLVIGGGLGVDYGDDGADRAPQA